MKVCLVCSSGGHLTEALQLLDAFAGHEVVFVTYSGAREPEVRALGPAYFTANLGMSPLRMAAAFPWALRVLLRERPGAIVSTGSEIALPFFALARLLGIRTIFIESWCRVRNLSLTGRLVYPLADSFFVQWPQLLGACGPRARYWGGVI